MQVKLATVPV